MQIGRWNELLIEQKSQMVEVGSLNASRKATWVQKSQIRTLISAENQRKLIEHWTREKWTNIARTSRKDNLT